MDHKFYRPFLIVLVIAILVACYFVFKPFLIDILIATVLVSILYKPYLALVRGFGGRRQLAALIMCVLAFILVMVPLTEVTIMAAKKSVGAYEQTRQYFTDNKVELKNNFSDKLAILGLDMSSFQSLAQDVVKNVSDMMVQLATTIVVGTTNFLASLLIIIFTMFFFFVDGDRMLERLKYWSPLPSKYDDKIFKKFKEVGYSTIITTFVVFLAQGLIGAIGYFIAGQPALFWGILIAVASLIPIVGCMIIYVPSGIYLILVGQVWQGIFILAWGFIIIGTIDNVIRAFMIKGKAHVNPIFVFFSILGGIAVFGFWGIVLGPLVVALAVTVMHIYELEFGRRLEGDPNTGSTRITNDKSNIDIIAERISNTVAVKGKRK